MKGLLALLPVLAAALPTTNVATIHNGVAPILSSTNAKHIPHSYLVAFKKDVTKEEAQDHHEWVQDIHVMSQTRKTDLRKRDQFSFQDTIFEGLKHTYDIAGGLLGYSGHFDEDVLDQIRRNPQVEFIEQDQEVHILSDPAIETNAPWGLARISHRPSLNFGTFNKYLYSENGGEGVDAYVIDTGTNIGHVDFGGRAYWGKTIPVGDEDKDGNGHGTHCSGTIAGTKFGVAKKANVYAVKVLMSNGSGSMSDVVKGVEWAAEAHMKKVKAAKKSKDKKFKGSVANMSLGGGKAKILDLAVNAAVDAGIHFAVAAGNDNADSCSYSPAAAVKAITVGASTLADERAYFSNFGKCNDIFAPGLNIISTWIGSKYAVNTISGTSMASPHVCGLLAYFLSLQPSKDSAFAVDEITPQKMKENMLAIGTVGALSDVPGNTKNLLAWNGGGKTNYSEIINDGGYEVKVGKKSDSGMTAKIKAELKQIADELERLALQY